MHIAKDKNINVRTSANSKSKVVTTVNQDKTVKVISENKDWVKVIANKKTGWVPRKYLVDEVTVNTVERKVTKAGTDYIKTDALNKGEQELFVKGKDGITSTIYKTKYKNGKLISKKTYLKITEQNLMNSTVLIGTAEPITEK